MDNQVALEVVAAELKKLRAKSYAELQPLTKAVIDKEVLGSDGKKYAVEIQAVWDDKKHKNLRVLCLVDDGGWRAFMPLSDAFIIAPDGSFVGE